jgi:hypothetical protein
MHSQIAEGEPNRRRIMVRAHTPTLRAFPHLSHDLLRNPCTMFAFMLSVLGALGMAAVIRIWDTDANVILGYRI